MPTTELAESATLDEALAETSPASDPPSQTSPTMATPSAAFISSNLVAQSHDDLWYLFHCRRPISCVPMASGHRES